MDNQYGPNFRLVQAFIALQIVGGSVFVLILLSALVAQHRGSARHPTWFSFCLSWINFCISYSLLSFAGQQLALPEPEHGLCVVQAALIYAAPPLTGSATVCLVTHLMLNILLALSDVPDKRRSSFTSTILVIVPWIIWVAVFIGLLLFGLRHPHHVGKSPNGTFCVFVETPLPKLTSVWATLAAILLIAEEITIGIILFRNREVIAIFGQSMTMAIRVFIFTIMGTAAIADALVFVTTKSRGIEFDILIAAVPLSAAIVFGSQRDILRVWMFWRRPSDAEIEHRTTPSAVFSTMLSSRMTISARVQSPTSTQTA